MSADPMSGRQCTWKPSLEAYQHHPVSHPTNSLMVGGRRTYCRDWRLVEIQEGWSVLATPDPSNVDVVLLRFRKQRTEQSPNEHATMIALNMPIHGYKKKLEASVAGNRNRRQAKRQVRIRHSPLPADHDRERVPV